jgi:hypothetical protein
MNPQLTAESENNKAFNIKFSNPKPRDSAKATRGNSATDWCDHCKRAGHNHDGYWVLNPHLRPNRNNDERNNWGGGKNRGQLQKFGGVSNMGASDPNENQAEPSNNRSDPSGSSVASAE